MLTDIYARSFLTATRTNELRLRDMPPVGASNHAPQGGKRKWIKRLIFGSRTRTLRDLSDL